MIFSRLQKNSSKFVIILMLNLMKNLIAAFCILCFYSAINPIVAQESNSISDYDNPIYDRDEDQLTNTDTIPDYRSKTDN